MITLTVKPELRNCPDCGEERTWFEQRHWRTGEITLHGHCTKEDCDLKEVTLDEAQWESITDAKKEEYRRIVRAGRGGA